MIVPDTAKAAEPPVSSAPAFASHPVLKAYPGRPYLYKPALSVAGAVKVTLEKGPDSMTVAKNQVSWLPTKEGKYPVVLEASLQAPGKKDSLRLKQSFTVVVGHIADIRLKPLPVQVNKGDTVTYDLRGSIYPAWALADLTARFDFDGDGKWDTQDLPLASNLNLHHAYSEVGRFSPKVEVRYKTFETNTVEGKVTVVSAVTATLKISPDTVEPGGALTIDVSESKGDGQLSYSVDIDGDGKPDWVDSSSTHATLKAPGSGVYQAVLTARNPMGQEGKSMHTVRVNAKTKLDMNIRNPKENMAAQVEIRAKILDPDDSLAQVKVNYSGAEGAWEIRSTPADSLPRPHEWWFKFHHAYGKVGKFAPMICVTSTDKREVCGKADVEIFNAPPVAQPGGELHATLGKPIEIEGDGVDPDGKIVKWEWDLNGDGKYDLASTVNGKFRYTFSKEGVFSLVLRVTTADGMTATGTRKVEVRKKWKT